MLVAALGTTSTPTTHSNPHQAESLTMDNVAETQPRPEFSPPITEHNGRSVTWDHPAEWELEPAASLRFHTDTSCEKCGYTGRKWMRLGRVHPYEGEMWRVDEVRTTGRSGRRYGARGEVKAWAVLRLFAYLCPACGDLRVVDLFPDEGDPV